MIKSRPFFFSIFFLLQTSTQLYFILKVLESDGWGSIAPRKIRLWRLFHFKAYILGNWWSEISRDSKSYSWNEYASQCILISTKTNGSSLGKFPTKVGHQGRWWSARPAKNKHMVNTNKKQKWNLFESDWENETTESRWFIVLEALKETYLAKLTLFLI